jgi:hypothetical protein
MGNAWRDFGVIKPNGGFARPSAHRPLIWNCYEDPENFFPRAVGHRGIAFANGLGRTRLLNA